MSDEQPTPLTPDADAPSEPQATLEESSQGWIIRQGDLAIVLARPGHPMAVRAPRVISIELAS